MTDIFFPKWIAEQAVADERYLLSRVEDGPLMSGADAVRFLVIHCSATRFDQAYPVEALRRDHLRRGFRTIGYHFYIRRDGTVTQHRKLLEVGAHAWGVNRCSIGICYEGGLDALGNPADTRTTQQRRELLELLEKLHRLFPQAVVVGHRELAGVSKACPCFSCAPYRERFNR